MTDQIIDKKDFPLTVTERPFFEEKEIDFLKIPLEGVPADDRLRVWLDPENEPKEDDLKKFFTPEVTQRLIYCPEINKDITDDAGYFGYEPGFIFICGTEYRGLRWPSDSGLNLKEVVAENGQKIWWVDILYKAPIHKAIYQLVTQERTPRTYAFLNNLLGEVKSE